MHFTLTVYLSKNFKTLHIRRPTVLCSPGRVGTYSVSQKKSPDFSDIFFKNGWEFLVQFLHTYSTYLSTLEYKFLFNYLQL